MKKKLLAVALLSAFSVPALAVDDDSGVYLVGSVGSVANITNVESGNSLSGMIGYQFNSFFSVEGGMTLLVDNAKYIVPPAPVVIAGATYNYTATSLAGSEFAAVLSLPMTEDLSILVRMGYAGLERTNTPSPPEVEVSWKGTATGVAVQYLLPHDFAVNGSKMRIGARLGVTRYNLTDATGLLTETPTNSYVSGVLHF